MASCSRLDDEQVSEEAGTAQPIGMIAGRKHRRTLVLFFSSFCYLPFRWSSKRNSRSSLAKCEKLNPGDTMGEGQDSFLSSLSTRVRCLEERKAAAGERMD